MQSKDAVFTHSDHFTGSFDSVSRRSGCLFRSSLSSDGGYVICHLAKSKDPIQIQVTFFTISVESLDQFQPGPRGQPAQGISFDERAIALS